MRAQKSYFNGMFRVGSFYNSQKMPNRSGNKSQKSSLDALKLTATVTKSKGRGKSTSVHKSQP